MGVVSSCTHFGSSSAHPTAPRPSAPRQSAPQRRPSSLRSHLLALPRRQRSPKTLSSLAQAAPRATARRVVRARGARQRWRRMLAQVWIVRLVWESPAANPTPNPNPNPNPNPGVDSATRLGVASSPAKIRAIAANLSSSIHRQHSASPLTHHHSASPPKPTPPPPVTLHPSPFTLHPSPFTRHPSPFTPTPSQRGVPGGQDNSCLTVERSSFTWMGYTMRTERYRYTEWVGWNGTALAPLWDQVVS